MRQHLHFLSNGGVFLEEEIHVDVKVTGGDAPGHTANHLRRTKGHVKLPQQSPEHSRTTRVSVEGEGRREGERESETLSNGDRPLIRALK